MKKVSLNDVEHIAELAKLELSDAEKKTMAAELESILSYVDRMSEVDTSGVESFAADPQEFPALRDDEPHPFDADMLRTTDRFRGGLLVAHAVFKERAKQDDPEEDNH